MLKPRKMPSKRDAGTRFIVSYAWVLNEVLIWGIAREQVPPMFELAEHDKHTVGSGLRRSVCTTISVPTALWP
jgi:hypothetical protein